jgi:hypothetical protein
MTAIRASMSEETGNPNSGEARGFKMGLRGRVGEGVYSLLLGARGLCPRKNFQITEARRRVLAHFQTKINTFMPVNFVKVPNPFDFQRLATEDARKKQTRSSEKTTE